MKLSDIVVEVRDRVLRRRGIIRPEDLDLTATIAFNGVGSWTIALATDHPMTKLLLTPGSGIIVSTKEDTLFSGPALGPELSASSTDPAGTLTISGITDDILLADRLAYPQPSNVDPTKQTEAHDVRKGVAETIMRQYVSWNCGPSAPTGRQDPYLTLASDEARGPVLTKSARFPALIDLVNEIAAAGNLGWRVIQRGSGRVFEVYSITDRTARIRLDLKNNTLSSEKVTVTPPSATRVLVAGQGEEVDRRFYEGTNDISKAAEAEWGRRIEVFVDQRQSDDTNEYVQKANEVLADKGSTLVAVELVPMDNSTMVFGKDWNIGDLVATDTRFGSYSAVVSSAAIRANSEGFVLGATLGDATLLQPNARQAAQLANAEKRIHHLEANAEISNQDYYAMSLMGVW